MRLPQLAAILLAVGCGGTDDSPDVGTVAAPPPAPPAPEAQPSAPAAQPSAPATGGGCPAAVSLHVADSETGGPVPGLFVRGLPISCREEPSGNVCSASPPSGSYDVVIGAPGYQEARMSVTVASTSSGAATECSQSIELGVTLSRR